MSSDVSPAQQVAFAQRKLEKHYTSIFKALFEYQHSIEVVQHVLVWRRPMLSLALYAFVHWIFVLQVRSNDGPVSQLGNLIFWLVMADMLYRAATKPYTESSGNEGSDGTSTGEGNSRSSNDGGGRGWRLRWRGRPQFPVMVTFEDAVMKRHTPREPGMLPPYEVICLWLADMWMFFDNTVLVLKHWSINEPFMFCASLGLPGLVLVLFGRYIPTLVLLYIFVMFLLTWPYIEHHNLRVKFIALAQTHYPGILQSIKAICVFLKTLALSRNKETEDNPEFSLSEGDDVRTEQALQEAFDQATGQQNQQQQVDQDQGMSLLQDSLFGLHSSDFQHSDMDSLVAGSLAPGSGEFPSVSHLDESLFLPSFPPQSQGSGTLPSIGEELEDDDTSFALSSEDLDPLMDSLEAEFGSDWIDTRRSNVTGQTRHRPVQPSPLTTTTRAPSQPTGSSQSNLASVSQQAASEVVAGYSQGFMPPPTYQSAVDGSDGGVTAAGGNDGYEWPIEDPPIPLGGVVGGSLAAPKSRSTPLIREGLRRRGQRQHEGSGQQQALQEEDNPLFAPGSGLLQELDTL